MAKIKIKLAEKSYKNFLVTQSGYTITKEFTEVDDKDSDIQYYIAARNDIIVEDVKKTESKSKKSKDINEKNEKPDDITEEQNQSAVETKKEK